MHHWLVRSAVWLSVAFAFPLSFHGQGQRSQETMLNPAADVSSAAQAPQAAGHPREDRLLKSSPFNGDVRTLPQLPVEKFERPELEDPDPHPVLYTGGTGTAPSSAVSANLPSPALSAPAPAPGISFEGLDFATWGAGHPPDTNGDAGPLYYIQTINTSVGIYNKSDGSRAAAFTFNSLMSQGSFGNLCDTNNFGDPVVLYDTFEDRWIITDFAFTLNGSGNVIAPTFQCFAVSRSGDPVAGGWNFYSIPINNALGDYPKFGIWIDGLYMSANVFSAGAGSAFQNARVWAFNKAQMYAGNPTVQVVSFDAPANDFTVLPGNARLQAGTPPAGTPNYFVSTWEFLNALTVYKFHVDWNSISLSTFTGPDIPLAATSWPNATAPNAPSLGGNSLDVLATRAMVQNQYTNIGGQESLWTAHTVRRLNTSGFAAPRWYQVNVTGGTVAANLPQAATWDPDGANVFYRFIPSVAVDHAGDMAMGYSVSSSTTKPAISYAGRLAGDPVNTFSQTEQLLIQGTGTQSGSCGGTCIRWGDYSAMTLDPDGCTFWYTAMYYQADGLAFNTRIAAFSFPGCTPVATGALQGTVIDSGGSNPISGAAITLGSRTTTTDINGNYSFAGLPSGTYPTISAGAPGYGPSSAGNIVITDGNTTTQNFSLTLAPTSGCFIDTTQSDFQAGVATNCDLTGSPGDVTLLNAPTVDQQNTAGTTTGTGFGTPNWTGQSFIPAVTATLVKVEVQLFCSGCTGTTPNLTLSVRATSAGLPTGADLATATIPGFSSSAGAHYTATFGSPATLTSGTQYALILRPNTAPSAGGYFWIRSSPSTYANGQRVLSSDSGTTWSADSTRDFNFKAYMQTGYAASGNLVSSLKDANPATNLSANWGTLSWTADTPVNTAIQFQIAAGNNAGGPFSFVGPDGTSGTFFGNGDSLAQFNGNRYLKYQASFSTSDPNATPVLHDVTICFNDLPTTTLLVAPATGIFGGTADLSATLTSNSLGVPGKSISFALNGNNAGSGISDASGLATVSTVSLAGINAGVYPAGISAAFAGDAGFLAANNTGTLTVSRADQSINFTGLADRTFGDADFSVSASTSSTLTVSFGATGNCTVTGSTAHLTGAGSCTITASQAGDSNYNAATDVPRAFSIAKASQTITFGALTGKNFGDPDFSVSASASSTLAVSFGASGNCSVTGATVHIAGAGSCTITASQAGDSNYNAATDVPQSFSIVKASQTITFGALGGKNFGDPDFSVSASASSTLAVSFGATGNCSVTAVTVHITGAGSCTITASQAGDSNYNAATDVPQAFSIAKTSQTITFGALTGKNFGDPDFSVSASASSTLAVSFGASGNCSVTGAIVHITGAGSCTITASQAGDSNVNPAGDVPQAFTINPATPNVAVACTTTTFNASSHSCSASATGIANVTVTGSSALTYNGGAPPSGAGTYAVAANFTSSDSNYSNAAGNGSLTINKAIPTVNVACPSGVLFDSNPHSCLAAATGVANVPVGGTSAITYNGSSIAPSALGNYAVSDSFTSSDSNYTNASGTGSLTISAGLPGVANLSPALTHASSGGFTLTMNGTNFVPGAVVNWNGSPRVTTFVSTSQLTASVAAADVAAVGVADVTVLNPAPGGGTSASFKFAVDTASGTPGAVTVSSGTSTLNVQHGQTTTLQVTFTGASANAQITVMCFNLPAGASCSLSGNTVTVTTSAGTPVGSYQIVLVFTATQQITAANLSQESGFLAAAMGLTGVPFGFLWIRRNRKKAGRHLLRMAGGLLIVGIWVGCGGRPHTVNNPQPVSSQASVAATLNVN